MWLWAACCRPMLYNVCPSSLFLWPLTSLGNVNGPFSSSETLRILQQREWLQMYWMRCCRKTKVGELLWGLLWGIENMGEGGVHDQSPISVHCIYGAKFFWGIICKNSSHCQGSNPWTTNISTENIFVSPHTLKKLLCKCPHLFKVYLLNFFLILPFLL
jgi:hypothetical protein